ncbi:MAG: M48 family metallopeptidase, partial [Armatimonadia bacterium]
KAGTPDWVTAVTLLSPPTRSQPGIPPPPSARPAVPPSAGVSPSVQTSPPPRPSAPPPGSPVLPAQAAPRASISAGSFRHKGETPAFITGFLILFGLLTLAAIVFVIQGLITGGLGFVLGLILLFPAVMVWSVGVAVATYWYRNSLRQRYPEVTPANYPQVHAAIQQAAALLGMKPLPVHIATDRPDVNAFVLGTGGLIDNPIVFIHQGLLATMSDPRQLCFVVGHEFGHVKASHLILKSYLENPLLESAMWGLLCRPAIWLIKVSMRQWDRLSEHTADRAGLIACGDLQTAVTALALTEFGPAETARLNLPELFAAAMAPQGAPSDLLSTHPALGRRIQDLVDFNRQRGATGVARSA